jgi:dephospho-CoA kinase
VPWLVLILLAYVARWILEVSHLASAASWTTKFLWALVALALAWRVLEWLSRRYTLTHREIVVRAGVLARVGADIPLRSVQHATLNQGPIERLLGLGSIGIATAGNDGPVAYLVMVPEPHSVLALVRAAVEAASSEPLPQCPPPHSRPIVIGLAGGIGAGKSAVARTFAARGALVIDSDQEAKDALDRPEVRAELIRWWGDEVLGPEGRIDRKKVSSIIFADPAQRQRLERLVHPLVRATRKEMIARTDQRTTPAVVVDAPLLYEAGLDQECDVVVFVDAPRELRLERVQRTRGWDEAELDRREKAQLPLEEKRARADYVIVNDSTPEALRGKADVIFSTICSSGAGGTPSP